jgi:glycosyltransferase involved in cell wall biosynthesis
MSSAMDGTRNVTRPVRTLLHAFPSFEVGGAQIRFTATANHLGDRYRHLIVAMNGQTQCLGRLGPQVRFELIEVDLPRQSTMRNFLSLRRLLRSLRPDKLITYNWGAIEWALANVIPVCRHIHIEDGFGPDEAALGQLPRRVLLRRLVLSRRSQVVLPSRTLAEIAATIWHLPPQRLTYLPNGIDCARFMGSPDTKLVSHLRRSANELLIGTVAALRPEKNLARLIEAFALLSPALPARLVIIGDGQERERLQQLAVLLGVGERVLFMGGMANPELILGALDVFALSSDTEQMPFSVLEAMAAGLPVAAVDVGDVRSMLSPANSKLVVAKSTRSLAWVIAGLLQDHAARAELGRNNRAFVQQNYDQSTMFERYADLFDE